MRGIISIELRGKSVFSCQKKGPPTAATALVRRFRLTQLLLFIFLRGARWKKEFFTFVKIIFLSIDDSIVKVYIFLRKK